MSRMPAALTGRTWKAKNASEKADAARDARQDGAGRPELHRQAERPEHQQEVGDLRVCQGAERPLGPRHRRRFA